MRRMPITATEVNNSFTTEGQFQQRLIETAELCGWMVYHTYDSRKSREGFPDLILVKEGVRVLLAMEVKRSRKEVRAMLQPANKRGRKQLAWIQALGEVETVHAEVVTPDDEQRIMDMLTGKVGIVGCKT